MIHSVMLVFLGFLLAVMLGLIVAPAFLRRAIRLNTRKLQAHLPNSLSDFRAQKDQLKADYAIRIRRLEVSLDIAKEKSAQLLVSLNKDEMKIQELEARNNELRASLAEKNSRSVVLEQTVRTEIPDLKQQLLESRDELSQKEALLAQAQENIQTQSSKLTHAARTERVRQTEIERLRQAVKKQNAESDKARKSRDHDSEEELQRVMITAQVLQDELNKSRHFEEVEVSKLKQQMREIGGLLFQVIEGEQGVDGGLRLSDNQMSMDKIVPRPAQPLHSTSEKVSDELAQEKVSLAQEKVSNEASQEMEFVPDRADEGISSILTSSSSGADIRKEDHSSSLDKRVEESGTTEPPSALPSESANYDARSETVSLDVQERYKPIDDELVKGDKEAGFGRKHITGLGKKSSSESENSLASRLKDAMRNGN